MNESCELLASSFRKNLDTHTLEETSEKFKDKVTVALTNRVDFFVIVFLDGSAFIDEVSSSMFIVVNAEAIFEMVSRHIEGRGKKLKECDRTLAASNFCTGIWALATEQAPENKEEIEEAINSLRQMIVFHYSSSGGDELGALFADGSFYFSRADGYQVTMDGEEFLQMLKEGCMEKYRRTLN